MLSDIFIYVVKTAVITTYVSNMRAWRNWQTRRTKDPVVEIPWRFEPSRPHYKKSLDLLSVDNKHKKKHVNL